MSEKLRITRRPLLSFLRKLFPNRTEIFFDQNNIYVVNSSGREQVFPLNQIRSIRKTYTMINNSMIWEIKIQSEEFRFAPGSRIWNTNFNDFLHLMNSRFPGVVK